MNERSSQAGAVPDVGDPLEPRENGGRDMEAEGLVGTTEGPVQGGDDTEGGPLIPEKVGPTPEPDVLERGIRILDETIEGGRADAVEVRAFVADAIAEIEERQRKQNAMADCIYNQSKEIAQLRAITEAEPVEYQARYKPRDGGSWIRYSKNQVEELSANPEWETRALYAEPTPNSETEEEGETDGT